MSFDAEEEWKTLQLTVYSENLFLEMAKDRKPCEIMAIIHAIMDVLFISTGCDEKAIRYFDDKFPELIDEVLVKVE